MAGGSAGLHDDGDAIHFVNEAFKHAKPIGAIGTGTDLLRAARLPDLRVSEPAGSGTEDDQGVVTCGAGASHDQFSGALVAAIAAHRHWGRAKAGVPALGPAGVSRR